MGPGDPPYRLLVAMLAAKPDSCAPAAHGGGGAVRIMSRPMAVFWPMSLYT